MTRIKDAFKEKAFIAFLTAGDPSYEESLENFRAAIRGGASLIEVGIPFSDPIAEGPVIQEADIRALASGMTTDKVFDLVKDIRKESDIPLVFMTYANPVFHYGLDRFFNNAAAAGADGIIIPDVPYEESKEFSEVAEKYGIDFIPLVAPTSEDRIKMIAASAKGFIYVVSSMGVTGVRSEINTDLKSMVESIRSVTDVPCAIGFGISKPEQAEKMAEIADGVIVGSAMVKIVASEKENAPKKLEEYVREMKDAVKSVE